MSNSLAIKTGTGFGRAFGRGERAASVAAASALKHIFVIPGPSGSGKSTFMGEFVFGRLTINISRDLPQGSKSGCARAVMDSLAMASPAFFAASASPRGSSSITTSFAPTAEASSTSPTTLPCKP